MQAGSARDVAKPLGPWFDRLHAWQIIFMFLQDCYCMLSRTHLIFVSPLHGSRELQKAGRTVSGGLVLAQGVEQVDAPGAEKKNQKKQLTRSAMYYIISLLC